jgi:hypothetical protein
MRLKMNNLMKVNWYYADTYWDDEPKENARWTIIGVLKGEWDNGMSDTYLNNRTICWFDTDEEVLALKEGSEIDDGLTIASIDYTPDYREEEYNTEEEAQNA